MASPSDSNPQEPAARKQSKGAPFKFLVPLVYAPVLPLSKSAAYHGFFNNVNPTWVVHLPVRISLRKNPVLRDRLFTAVLVGAFAHGFYLVTDIYDAESK